MSGSSARDPRAPRSERPRGGPLRRCGALAALALSAGAAGAAGPLPARERVFEETAEVIEVQVPVNVLDREGRPVRGLTAADFEVLDEGRPRALSAFRVVDLEILAPGEAADIPAAARRHVLLLFDFSFSSPTALLRAREAARRFVLGSLHPTDLVAVATHTVDGGTRLVVTFTPDRGQLARAIDTLGAPRLLDRSRRDPLLFLLEDPLGESGLATADLGGSDTGVVGALSQDVAGHIQILGKQIEITEKSFARGRISGWSRSLGELARTLDAVKGRKQVVLFSEGFDGRLLFGRRPSGDDPEQRQDMVNLQFGNYWMVDMDDIYGNSQLQTDVDTMLEQFRRADCVIQAVDISGLRAETGRAEAAQSVGQDALFYLANDTGGRLYEEANDFAGELDKALATSEVTYLLSFQPVDLPRDGSYRRLKVRVSTPRGVQISHRLGYYAPRPFEQLHPLERNLLAADAIASAEPRQDLELSVLAVAFRAGSGRAYVPVIVEVAGAGLLAGHAGDQLGVELYAYVTDRDGQMRDFFTQRVGLDLSRGRATFARTGLKYYGHLDLPPGAYLVRVLARNDATGRTGVAAVPLAVPAALEAAPALLPPFFLEPPGSWFLVRENPASGYQASVIYPFTVNGEPYVPAARPALTPDVPARFCLVAYNLNADPVELAGRVLAPDGQEVAGGGRVALLERTVTGIRGLDKLLATFEPDGLEAGSYRLEVAVKNPASGAVEFNSIPFVIPD